MVRDPGLKHSLAVHLVNNNVNNAVVVAPTIDGGHSEGMALRASDNGTANQITVPDGGAQPTIGTNEIWDAGNLTPGDYATLAHEHAIADITPVEEFADGFISETAVTQHKSALSKITSITFSSADFDLVAATHVGTKVIYNGSTEDVVVNVRADAFDATNVGDIILIANRGAGSAPTVTINPQGGTVIKAAGNVTPIVISNINGVVALHCTNTDEWDVVGDYDL